jgi:hypothetical protein
VDWVDSIQRTIDYIEDNIEAKLDSEILAGYELLNTFSRISVKSNLSGGKTCEVTTIDGSVLKFFEL